MARDPQRFVVIQVWGPGGLVLSSAPTGTDSPSPPTSIPRTTRLGCPAPWTAPSTGRCWRRRTWTTWWMLRSTWSLTRASSAQRPPPPTAAASPPRGYGLEGGVWGQRAAAGSLGHKVLNATRRPRGHRAAPWHRARLCALLPPQSTAETPADTTEGEESAAFPFPPQSLVEGPECPVPEALEVDGGAKGALPSPPATRYSEDPTALPGDESEGLDPEGFATPAAHATMPGRAIRNPGEGGKDPAWPLTHPLSLQST